MNEPDNLVTRLNQLQDEHPWMDAQVSTTLAASPTSDDDLRSIAGSLKEQIAQTWDGISHFYDDPVLQKAPTMSATLRRYITGALGPVPIQGGSLAHIQTQLQAKGLGTGLEVTGAWNTQWQQVLQEHALAERAREFGGDKPGSVNAGGLLHSVLRSISPSGMADSLVGFVKSIPADLRQLATDTGGAFAQLGHGAHELVTDPLSLFERGGEVGAETRQARGTGQALINQMLGGDLSTEQAIAQAGSPDDFVNLINDLGTVFLLSGGASLTTGSRAAISKARAEGFTTRLTTQEAVRAQGAIAKTLLRPVGTRAAGGAALGATVGGAQAAVRDESITQGALMGAALGAVTGAALPARAFNNLPIMKNTGPTLGKLLDNEGLYYTTRTRLATPYAFGGVRAAGTVFGQAQAFSLKAHAVSYLQSKFGDDAGIIQSSIENANVLDAVDDALRDRLAFTAAGIHFEPDLDYLMFFLHGPYNSGTAGTASVVMGDTVQGGMRGFNEALQNVGAIAQVEQGTGRSFKELLALTNGDPDRLHMWIGNKVRQHAAHQHAEEVLGRLAAADPARYHAMHIDDRMDLLRAESSAVWHDPDLMRVAIGRMLGSGENYLARQIQNELSRSIIHPSAQLKHELSDYLTAGDILTHQVLPHAGKYLLHPTSVTELPKGLDPAVWGGKVPDDLYVTTSQMRTGEATAGTFGLARYHSGKDGVEDATSSTLTSQQATQDLHRFAEQLQAADTPEANAAFVNDALTYLFNNYGLDARALSVFDSRPEKLLNLLADKSKTLAAEVHLTADAPPELVRAFEQIRASGYRVVAGTDIGHAFRSDLPPLPDLGAPISRARKVISGMGLNPQHFSRLDYGADRRLKITQALQQQVDAGKITLPPFYTVQTLLKDLQDDKIVGKQLPWAANLLFSAARPWHKGAKEGLIEQGAAQTVEEAEQVLKANIAAAGGLRNLTVHDIRRVLTRTDNVPWAAQQGGDNLIPLMSEADATKVWKALQRGFSETPAGMVGLQKVEDFARYLPFRVEQKLTKGRTSKLTDNAATLALMSLPTNIVRVRDHLRFTLSPFFSLSQVAETNLKMMVDGVAGTFTPVKYLREKGIWNESHQLLDRIHGAESARYKYLDEADRYLDHQDVFGLFNPRHYEAYYAYEKKQAGWSDEQISEGLVRVFMYGTRGKEGRTALERTTNFIWFPFSFSKSLVKNVGGYLLDKPAQALILSNALDGYRDFSNHHLNGDNPLASSWYTEHLPLLNEALRLNTFARGLSLGEFGGINRPLLNAFLPQSWEGNEKSMQTLRRYVPVVNDMRRIMREGSDQTRIVRQALLNGIATLEGEPVSTLNARPVAKTSAAQRLEAVTWRNELITAFKDVLEYNASVDTDEQKYHFGTGQNIPEKLQGAVIDRTNLGRIVQHKYPVYNPYTGASFAIEQQREAETWLRSRRNTPEYEAYRDFYDKAKTAVRHLNDEAYPTGQAAQVQALFHDAAQEFASKDREFYGWYRKHFARILGPLEAVT